jgi:hypothetical protein
MNRAIGTHKYSQNKDSAGNYSSSSKNVYHQNIQIKNNVFKNIYDNAIYMVNWKNTTISKNQFTNIGQECNRDTTTARHAIAGGGITGITISNNQFNKVASSVIYFKVMRNNGSGKQYYPVFVYVTEKELETMKSNQVTDCERDPYYEEYDVLLFGGDGERSWMNAYGMDLLTKTIFPKPED